MPPKTTKTTQAVTPVPRTTTRTVQPKTGVGAWYWPVAGNRITTQFVEGHRAVDIGVPVGTVLRAPTSGVVTEVRQDVGGYGNNIRIQDAKGDLIILAHLSAFNVKPGDRVVAGQQIGLTGNTGNSTGPHLHYEIRQGSGRIDPLKLPYVGSVARGLPTAGSLYYPAQGRPSASYVSYKPGTPSSSEQPQEPSSFGDKIISGVLSESIGKTKIKWQNVIVGGIGVIIIGIGVYGLVSGEAIKQVVKPAAGEIASALKGAQ